MKTLKYIIAILFLSIPFGVNSQELRKEVFEMLDLNYPGLEQVKAACDKQEWEKASSALLDYYRNRTSIKHPDIDLNNIKITAEEQKWADDALEHTFLFIKDISLRITMERI